jgi:hypothetical protein
VAAKAPGPPLQPLPPHDPARGFLFRRLSVSRLYGDRIRPLAPAAPSLWSLGSARLGSARSSARPQAASRLLPTPRLASLDCARGAP